MENAGFAILQLKENGLKWNADCGMNLEKFCYRILGNLQSTIRNCEGG